MPIPPETATVSIVDCDASLICSEKFSDIELYLICDLQQKHWISQVPLHWMVHEMVWLYTLNTNQSNISSTCTVQ